MQSWRVHALEYTVCLSRGLQQALRCAICANNNTEITLENQNQIKSINLLSGRLGNAVLAFGTATTAAENPCG